MFRTHLDFGLVGQRAIEAGHVDGPSPGVGVEGQLVSRVVGEQAAAHLAVLTQVQRPTEDLILRLSHVHDGRSSIGEDGSTLQENAAHWPIVDQPTQWIWHLSQPLHTSSAALLANRTAWSLAGVLAKRQVTEPYWYVPSVSDAPPPEGTQNSNHSPTHAETTMGRK